MKWYNLSKNKCPMCGAKLFSPEGETIINCINNKCNFKIGIEKFKEISMKQNEKSLEVKANEAEDNQTALNNL